LNRRCQLSSARRRRNTPPRPIALRSVSTNSCGGAHAAGALQLPPGTWSPVPAGIWLLSPALSVSPAFDSTPSKADVTAAWAEEIPPLITPKRSPITAKSVS
jgi:hypothetical protein